MPEIPGDISVETTGWLITLAVALVFVVAIAVLSYWQLKPDHSAA